jgi:hypothetical protein
MTAPNFTLSFPLELTMRSRGARLLILVVSNRLRSW